MSSVGPSTSRPGFRSFLTPLGPARKRKDRDTPLPLSRLAPTKLQKPAEPAPSPTPKPNNGFLLAGYLAHEYLTCGTLLGETFEGKKKEAEPARAYEEVSALVMGENGPRVIGVVNPTQLGRWIQTMQ